MHVLVCSEKYEIMDHPVAGICGHQAKLFFLHPALCKDRLMNLLMMNTVIAALSIKSQLTISSSSSSKEMRVGLRWSGPAGVGFAHTVFTFSPSETSDKVRPQIAPLYLGSRIRTLDLQSNLQGRY